MFSNKILCKGTYFFLLLTAESAEIAEILFKNELHELFVSFVSFDDHLMTRITRILVSSFDDFILLSTNCTSFTNVYSTFCHTHADCALSSL